MVKFVLEGENGTSVIGLGITEGNVDRLKAGLPIRVRGADIDMPAIEVLIFYGVDESALYTIVKDKIGRDTSVRVDGKEI